MYSDVRCRQQTFWVASGGPSRDSRAVAADGISGHDKITAHALQQLQSQDINMASSACACIWSSRRINMCFKAWNGIQCLMSLCFIIVCQCQTNKAMETWDWTVCLRTLFPLDTVICLKSFSSNNIQYYSQSKTLKQINSSWHCEAEGAWQPSTELYCIFWYEKKDYWTIFCILDEYQIVLRMNSAIYWYILDNFTILEEWDIHDWLWKVWCGVMMLSW